MIENGEWEKFPSKVHPKGFLKIYSEYLQIEPSLVEKGIKKHCRRSQVKRNRVQKTTTILRVQTYLRVLNGQDNI